RNPGRTPGYAVSFLRVMRLIPNWGCQARCGGVLDARPRSPATAASTRVAGNQLHALSADGERVLRALRDVDPVACGQRLAVERDRALENEAHPRALIVRVRGDLRAWLPHGHVHVGRVEERERELPLLEPVGRVQRLQQLCRRLRFGVARRDDLLRI